MQDCWSEFNVPFQRKYGYIRDEPNARNLRHSDPEIAKKYQMQTEHDMYQEDNTICRIMYVMGKDI